MLAIGRLFNHPHVMRALHLIAFFALAAACFGETNAPTRLLDFARLDRDASGGVDAEEWTGAQGPQLARRFAALDADRSGALEPNEVARALAAAEARLKELDGLAPAPPTFAELDADGDGRVVFAEYRAAQLAAMRARFAALDTNGDGAIQPAEFEAARAAFLRQLGAGSTPAAEQ